MLNFAQATCLHYIDHQSVFLEHIWFIMLIASAVLSALFFILKQKQFSLFFALFLGALILLKILNPADECGYSGFFGSSGFGPYIFSILAIILVIGLARGFIGYRKTRVRASSK